MNDESQDSDVIRAPGPDELNPTGKLALGITYALQNAGIITYNQLSNYSACALCTIPGILPGMIPHIESEMARRNLCLKLGASVIHANSTELSVGGLMPKKIALALGAEGIYTYDSLSRLTEEQLYRWGLGYAVPVIKRELAIRGLARAAEEGPAASAVGSSHHHRERATLRDRFAMAALSGLVSNLDLRADGYRANIQIVCQNAYDIADEMMCTRACEEAE